LEKVKEKQTKIQSKLIPFVPEADFYFTKGIGAFQKRKFDIAIKWMKKALEIKPNDPLYQCQMSIIYTEIGAYHAANQLLTNVLQKSDYVDCYYLLANNYAHLGLLNDAKKYANLYLDKEPYGDFTKDAEQLLRIIDFDEEESDWELEDEDELLIYQETAFYHMENLEWDKATVVIEEMLSLFPESIIVKHDYAQALFFSGNKREAIKMEKEILKEQPHSLYSYTNLGVFFYELNKKEYESYIKNLLNVYPMHEQQKLRIAVTLSRTGYYEEAYDRFSSLAKEKVKSHPSYYRWYAAAAYNKGKKEKALALWEEGCSEHPKLQSEDFPWNK